MALFKILKGDSSRISMDITPFCEGCVYYTKDDGGVYVDVDADGVQKRVRINPECPVTEEALAEALGQKQDMLIPDGSVTIQNGTIGVTTPVYGVFTQAEYDALPEERRNKGVYVIPDGGSGNQYVTMDQVNEAIQNAITGAIEEVYDGA